MKVKFTDEDDGLTTLRGIGFRADCPCGWRGKFRVSFPVARSDAAEHNREHRGTP